MSEKQINEPIGLVTDWVLLADADVEGDRKPGYLRGKLFNAQFPDGTNHTTPYLVGLKEIDGKGDVIIVCSDQSLFALGQPSSDYEDQFPNSRDRLVTQVMKLGLKQPNQRKSKR